MKKILFLILLISFNAQGATQDEAINNACLKQAVSLAQKLKADIFTRMDSNQTDNVIRLSTESCKQQFTANETKQVISQANEKNENSGSMDWFTDKVLNGEPAHKAGNERLKRMRTR